MTTQSLLPNDLIDALLSNYKKPEDLIGENGLLKQLTKALVERALQAEMTEHLGHDKHSPVNNTAGNARNGKSTKTLKGDFGALPIEIPRDRHGSFEPQLIPKHQTRWTGFDDKIISLYSRGMTVREIQQHLTEMYGTEVSATLISTVTDAVLDEVKHWQSRPLDAVYPIVYLDCIHVKIRDTGAVRAKAAYLAIGINMNGEKEVLGLWIAQTEGAKFWLSVVTELKNRGVQDIFIACVDGKTRNCAPEPNIHKHALINCLQVSGCPTRIAVNFFKFANIRFYSSLFKFIRFMPAKISNFPDWRNINRT